MPSRRRPAKRRTGWEASLAHVITIMRGPTLKTLAEARAYILRLPKGKQARWEIAVRCLLHAADSGSAEDIKAATRAIELAGSVLIGQYRAGLSVRRTAAHSARTKKAHGPAHQERADVTGLSNFA